MAAGALGSQVNQAFLAQQANQGLGFLHSHLESLFRIEVNNNLTAKLVPVQHV